MNTQKIYSPKKYEFWDEFWDEFLLENKTIELLSNLGYVWTNFKNRKQSELLIIDDLSDFLSDPVIAIEVINTLKNFSNDSINYKNGIFFECIQKGIYVKSQNKRIPLIDFQSPEKNCFRIVNQLTIKEGNKTRRPDLIIYINGFPLIIFELKSPQRKGRVLYHAYNQLTDNYLREIVDLFKYSLMLVVANGFYHRYGTIHNPYIEWNRWGEDFLDDLITNLFNKDILINYIKDFVYINDLKFVGLSSGNLYKKIKLLIFEILKISKKIKKELFFIEPIKQNYEALIILKRIIKANELKDHSIIWFIEENTIWLNELLSVSKEFIQINKWLDKESLKKDLKANQIYLTDIRQYLKAPFLITNNSFVICIFKKYYKNIKFNKWTIWKMKIKTFLRFKNINDTFYYNPKYTNILDYLKITCPNAIYLVEKNDNDKESVSLEFTFLVASIVIIIVFVFVLILSWIIYFASTTYPYKYYPRYF